MGGERKTILVVEDEAVAAFSQAQTLKQFGYDVMTANSGEKAVRLVQENEALDLILMDIELGPGIDGIQAAETILRSRDIPILFLSSHTEPEIVEKTERINSYGYVLKNAGETVLVVSIKMAFRLFDARNREKAKEDLLQDSERKYRTMFESMAQGVVFQDAEGKIISANPAAERILGLSLSQMQGRTSLDPRWRTIHENGTVFPGETHPAMVALKFGREAQAVMGVFHPTEGSYRWISVHAVPLTKPGEQAPYQVFVSFEDITDLKKAETALQQSLNEKDLLMKELQHRVKNNLNVVQSMLSLEIDRTKSEDLRQVLIDARSRIHTMSSIYERLYRSSEIGMIDLHLYIEDFIRSLHDMYILEPGRLRFATKLEEMRLELKRAIPLCLILNELVSNAYKHAYPDGRRGEIRISLRIYQNEHAELVVSDDGIGFPEGFDAASSEGMGLLLVRMLTEQIGGTLRTETNLGCGASVSIRFRI